MTRYTSAAVLLDRVRDALCADASSAEDDVGRALALKIELTKAMLLGDETAVGVCADEIEKMARRVCPQARGEGN